MNEELELIKDKIKFLENQLASLKQRVEAYEENHGLTSKIKNDNASVSCASDEEKVEIVEIDETDFDIQNKDNYVKWFVDINKGEEKTAIRHFDQLKAWKKRLIEDMNLKIDGEVYDIDDSTKFDQLINLFENNDDMKQKNAEKHHHYYSAAYHSFSKFLHWKELSDTAITSKASKVDVNISLLEQKYGKLIKVEKNVYRTNNFEYGFIIINSKTYNPDTKPNYWFAYRMKKVDALTSCKNIYISLGFGNPFKMYLVPNKFFEDNKKRLIPTFFEDGSISHYHISLFDEHNTITIRLSNPTERVNLKEYLFK